MRYSFREVNHLSDLIIDLALLLVVAAVAALVFKRLKQPLILGYMTAGLLVGPYNTWFPTLSDPFSIDVWAELGVIFLLFFLGIEFSFSKLKNVGTTAIVTAFVEVAAMFTLGTFFGLAIGWSWIQGLFLGAAFSISSTSIIIKAFDELKVGSQKFAQNVFGILILEDLIAVILLVFLTTMGISRDFQGAELIKTIAKLVFFLIAWFTVALFLIPPFLKMFAKYLSNEVLLIFCIGLCLATAVMASNVGFSAALGAFLMGAVLGETDLKDRIEKIFLPVKDLFAAIFFVSVGMMINIAVILEHPLLILGLTFFVICGKIVFVTFGSFLSGESTKTSVASGLSMAQIGEFSFIFAGLAATLKVMGEELYSLAIAVSALTAFSTPYLIRSRDRLSPWIEKLMPSRMKRALETYSGTTFQIGARADWRNLFNAYLLKILINAVIVITIFLLMGRFAYPKLLKLELAPAQVVRFSVLLLTMLFASPFLWALIFSHPKNTELVEFVKQNVSKTIRQLFLIARLLVASMLVTALLAQFLSTRHVLLVSNLLLLAIALVAFKYMEPIYAWIESRFLRQIGPNENLSRSHQKPIAPVAPWDAHLSEFTITPESKLVGIPLIQLNLREKFGVIITMIHRGTKVINAPGRADSLMPHDRIYLIGTDEELAGFGKYLEQNATEDLVKETREVSLSQHMVSEKSPFLGKSIRESGIREHTLGLVVGIERDGKRILNPDSTLTIQTGDLLWIVGDLQKISSL